MINLFKFFNMQHKSLLLMWNSSSDRYEFYNLSLSNYTYTQNLIDRSINGLFFDIRLTTTTKKNTNHYTINHCIFICWSRDGFLFRYPGILSNRMNKMTIYTQER